MDELVGRGDARATCDEGDGVVEVGGPFEAGDDDGEEKRVTGGKGVDVGGLLAVGVAFDEEVDGAGLGAVGDWCIRAQDGEGLSRGPGNGEKSGYEQRISLLKFISSHNPDRRHPMKNSPVKGNPLTSFSPGNLKLNFLVLWLTSSLFSSANLVNTGPGLPKTFFPSLTGDSASAVVIMNFEIIAPPIPATAIPLNTVGP